MTQAMPPRADDPPPPPWRGREVYGTVLMLPQGTDGQKGMAMRRGENFESMYRVRVAGAVLRRAAAGQHVLGNAQPQRRAVTAAAAAAAEHRHCAHVRRLDDGEQRAPPRRAARAVAAARRARPW